MKDNYVVELTAPVAIVEKDARRADEVRIRLEQLENTDTLNIFERGDLWAEVKAESYWSSWKFESFDDYIKKSGIDLSKREVAYRIQVSTVSKLLGVNKTQLAKAKMSKLKLIYSLDPNAVVHDEATQTDEKMSDIMIALVQDAPNKSIKEISEIVKRIKGDVEEPADELTWLNLPVRRDAKEVVTSAIDLAVKLAGQTPDMLTKELKDISNASALEKICADFKADPNNTVGEFEDEGADYEDSHDDAGGDDSQEDDTEWEDEDDDE